MIDPTQRFSTRVDNYVKYRPGYPAGVLATLQEDCGLTPASVIADIGSGTGILTELFLRNGNTVFAVEPNDAMRQAAERLLGGYANFHSLPARAEATGLPERSVDFIVAGQAFHWFDPLQARLEFTRLLRPGGWVMLVWNEREAQSSPFLVAYEALLQRYAIDYPKVDHRQVDHPALSRFYGPAGFHTRTFSHQQDFDLPGLQGRLLSSSYSPEPGHPDHAPMLAELVAIFEAHQVDGRVAFAYTARMHYGQLS